MTNYQSEITEFINQLKQDNPQLEQSQRDGRALLWDKAVDFDQQKRWHASQVKQTAYVYQTSSE